MEVFDVPWGPQETARGSHVEDCPCTGGGLVACYEHFCLPWMPTHHGNSSADEHSRSQSLGHAKAASHGQHPYAYKSSWAARERLSMVREPTGRSCPAGSHRKSILSVPAQGAEVPKAGGRGATLSNQASIPVHHSAARPSRSDGNIISRARYL